MQGYETLYRQRVDQYRLVYQIKQDELIVFVLKAGERRYLQKYLKTESISAGMQTLVCIL